MGHRVEEANVMEAKAREKVRDHRDLTGNLASVTPSNKVDAARALRNANLLTCSTPMTLIRRLIRGPGAAPQPAIPVRAVSPVPVLTSP